MAGGPRRLASGDGDYTQSTAGPGKQNELSCLGKVLLLDAVETSKHVQRAVDEFVSTLSFKVQ